MNSIRPTSKSRLHEVSRAIQQQGSNTSRRPMVVGIAGGSSSGKTTLAASVAKVLGNKTVPFSQDNFQLGKNFGQLKESPYRWDDPKNFQFDKCAEALMRLAKESSITVPLFDVVENRSIGTTAIKQAPIILWEGIYAFGDKTLRKLVDYAIYVDTPFMLRLVRRIDRFLRRDPSVIDDYSVPARQSLTFVLSAHRKFCVPQRAIADLVINFDESLIPGEVSAFIERRRRQSKGLFSYKPTRDPLMRTSYYGLELLLYEDAFVVEDLRRDVLYVAPLDSSAAAQIRTNWGNIYTDY